MVAEQNIYYLDSVALTDARAISTVKRASVRYTRDKSQATWFSLKTVNTSKSQ